MERAVQQRDAPDEALGMNVSDDGLGIINVRFAGYRRCSADREAKRGS
jgi:hypothetical protein